ncbi:hypothetical protein [Oceanobacillus picturae]|uniref:hypothetical protein n=1 Tax=Oceanobacillus picturae TaxID=171693 RepID=UPI000E691E0F|nr:hypothetical protein [Oceanobacillus picturae]RIU91362.1 hypothetical protein D1864_11365 [Oceanobacillus picturae]
MNSKKKTGMILGIASLLMVFICFIIFLFRGPNPNIHIDATIFIVLSAIGIVLAIFSWIRSKRLTFLIIGLLGNGVVMGFGFLLLLAMGLSEAMNEVDRNLFL